MKNNNYEFIRLSPKGKTKIIKKTDDLAGLIIMKRGYRDGRRYRYRIRPEVVIVNVSRV